MTTAGRRPTVSIMIPTFNQERVISQAVESALNQDYPYLEVVLVDDCSNDDTRRVLERFNTDPRFRYHRNPANLGRVGNYRNALNHLVRGEFVLNLDGDDWLIDRRYITDAVEMLLADSTMNFVFAKQIEFDTLFRFDTSQNRLEAGVLDGPKLFLDYASKNIAFPHLTVLYRRSRALEVGFYQLDALGADTASMLRLSLIGPVGFIDRPVGVWRIHPKSASSQRDQRTRVDNLEVIENAFRFAAKLEVHPRSVLERWRRAVLRIRLRGLLSSEREAGSLRSTLLLFGRLTAKYPRLSLSLFAQLPKFVRRRNQKLTSQSLADLRVMIERSNGVEGGNAERD